MNTVRYSREALLLLLTVKIGSGDEEAEEAGRLITSHGFDWDDLYARVEAHSTGPQLESFLKSTLPGRAPEEFMARLEDDNRENALRQLRNLSEFFRVREYLEEHGVPVVPFKGFILAIQLYGTAASRESGDVDLYIRRSDLDRVISLMPGLGYSYETSSHPRYVEKLKKVSAEFNFDRHEGETCINHFEFHWRMGSSRHGFDVSFEELAPRMVTGRHQGHEFPVYDSTAHLLLTLMHHAGKDHLVNLKHILDLGLFFRESDAIDWDWLRSKMRSYDAERLLYVAAGLASKVTGVAVPDTLMSGAHSPAIRQMTEERLRLILSRPGGFSSEQYERKNFRFLLRSRSGFRVRAMMAGDCLWTVIRRAVVPDRLMRVYLKKRYSIGGD